VGINKKMKEKIGGKWREKIEKDER